MDTSPEKYVDRMREVTEKKYGLLEEMLDLTKEQAQSLTEDGLEKLGKLVDIKQAKIDHINKLDDEFNVYFHRLKSELKIRSLDELKDPAIGGVKELKESISNVMRLLGEISQLEKRNNEGAKALLSDISSEIRKINAGKKVNSAYNPTQIQTSSYFIDKKK
jgi:hypothetical protein